MDYPAFDFDVNLDPAGFVIDVDSLYAHLAMLTDRRHARGKRYALVTLLAFIVLAKLAGEDRVYGIAQWVHHRREALAEALHLKKPRAPCVNTYRRLLGDGIDVEEMERAVRAFFAAQPGAGQSVVVALEGKTRRGTISAGQTHGRQSASRLFTGGRVGALPSGSGEPGERNPRGRAGAEMLGLMGENRDWGCPVRPARAIVADCGGRGRVCVGRQG
jgi:hypothetical protein